MKTIPIYSRILIVSILGSLFAPLLVAQSLPASPTVKSSNSKDAPATVLSTAYFQEHAHDALYLNLHDIGKAVVTDLVIGQPPQPGTAAFTADDTSRLAIYNYATTEEIDQAKTATYDLFSFSAILGSNFSANQLPQTAALFAQVDADTAAANTAAKNTFHRHHPLRDGGFCYPSDHAANVFLYATLLSEIYPEQKEVFSRYAIQLSQNRIILGGHYPADIVAGQIYGIYLARELLKKDSFQEKWKEAKHEITTVIANQNTTLPPELN